MKKYNIISSAFVAAAALAFSACDDGKELTLNAPDSKLLEEITFDVSEILPLGVGMDSLLVWSAGPEEVDDPSVIFTSSNPEVASVDNNGLIRALSIGEAQITATTSLGFKVNEAMASVTVQVIPEIIKATSIELENTTSLGEDGVIYVTDELQFSATILPENHTYSNLSWYSADESIATVDQTGLVKCVGAGRATIYVLAHDYGTARAEYSFDVKPYIEAESIEITPLDGPICLSRGPVALTVKYNPSGATLGSVEWSSSDESIATVHRGVVTPKGFGTVTITGTCIGNGAQASTEVTVDPGFLIWDAQNQWNGWVVSSADAPDTRTENFWHVEFKDPAGGKWRRDIKVDCSEKNPLQLSLKNYPVFAVRMTKINGGNSTLDAVTLEAGNAGNPNPKNGIDLGDGTQLLIYNLGTRPNFVGQDILNFRVFQIKLADIPYENMTAATAFYNVYWLRMFKSEDEAKEFANQEVAQGK